MRALLECIKAYRHHEVRRHWSLRTFFYQSIGLISYSMRIQLLKKLLDWEKTNLNVGK